LARRAAAPISAAAATLVFVLAFAAGCADTNRASGARFTGDESLLDLVNVGRRETPRQLIEAAMNEFKPDERARGITELATRPFGADPVFVELYRRGLNDDDASVRAAAARALGLHGGAAYAAPVAELMTDEDDLVRWKAAIALQRLHDPAAVEPLIARLDEQAEQNVQVRTAAATALGQYAERRVLDALIDALDDPDLAVNAAAKQSLETLTGAERGYRPRSWVAWLSETEDPFAGRRTFIYPAFNRDARWWEWVNPFYEVPNEMAARPAGMPAVERR
jgi:hypothetical protein